MDTDVHRLDERSGQRRARRGPSIRSRRGPNVNRVADPPSKLTLGVIYGPNVHRAALSDANVTLGPRWLARFRPTAKPPAKSPIDATAPPVDPYDPPDSSAHGAKLLAMLLVIAAVTAGVVMLAGGGDAFWIAVPGSLLVAAGAPGRLIAIFRAGAILLAAALPPLLDSHLHPLPAAPLVIGVPLACLAVLLTMRTRLEQERDGLRRSALTDPLTGIGNRRSLLGRIEYEITRHRRAGRSFALVMLDLDGFKSLNDRFGHGAGDDLLRETAAALERTVRAQDTAARIGGDEFCVLAPETYGAGLAQLEGRIDQAIAGVTAGVDTLQASIGAAVFPDDGTTPESLIAAADRRLLAAKRELRRDGDPARAAA